MLDRELAKAGIRFTPPIPRDVATSAGETTVTVGTLRMRAPRSVASVEICHEMFVQRHYEDAVLLPGSCVVDVGAHVGFFALACAARHPQIRVIAIEPAAATFALLEGNVAANHLQNVEPVCAAVGRTDGRITFFQRGDSDAHTLFQHDVYGSSFRPLAEIDCLRLDTVFQRFAISDCSLVKLNCEGAEFDIVMNSSPATLARIRALAGHYHVGLNDGRPAELRAFLEAAGFQCRFSPLLSAEHGVFSAVRAA